jgi:TolB-like protein/Tfp pilus assembly protein PilF
MSDASKAVFLSYASQDAEAAKKICEALRAAGVEVWFDQSELVGGDAWDQKIRKQIRDCALLIPVISASTQARHEGYFRLEWRLADQRTHLMGRSKAFLLPVSIDGTRDADADVPDSFVAVQWTKAPGGAVPPAFVARVKQLLDGQVENGGGALRPDSTNQSGPKAAPTANRQRWIAPVLGGLVVAIIALAIARPWRTPPAPGAAPPASTSPSAAVLDRVRGTLRKIYASRAELDLAAELLAQAAKSDPSNAQVFATWALLDCRYLNDYYDISSIRRDAASRHIAQATSLDGADPEVRFARAIALERLDSNDASRAEATTLLEGVLKDLPEDPRALGQLGWLAKDLPTADQWWARQARVPGWAATAHFHRGLRHVFEGDYRGAYAGLEEASALDRGANIRMWKAYLEIVWFGDLAKARRTVAEVTAEAFSEDMAASARYFVAYWARDYEGALAALQAIPRDFMESVASTQPTGYARGQALFMLGRVAAAENEWRAALVVTDRRLTAEPNDPHLLRAKALLLAVLGNKPEAGRVAKTAYELEPDTGDWLDDYLAATLLEPDRAVVRLQEKFLHHRSWHTAAILRLNPYYDNLRADPRFLVLQAEADADPALSPTAPARAVIGTAPSVDQKSVAVLAFANLSDDKANEYFSDGISEELLNVLAKIPGLKVAARTSAFYFKGKEVPVPEIAGQLGVAYVVEGSVRKSGDKVRITAQLIKASDGFHVWSDTFTRDIKDVFAVQDEIAGLIAQQLQLKLADAPARDQTVNPEAHQLYLQGRYFANQPSTANLAKAVDFLQRAVDLDPSFAPAWGALARNVALQAEYLETTPESLRERFARARRAADRAIALAPKLPDGYFARFEIQTAYDYDWAGARDSLDTALALAPADALLISNASQLATQFSQVSRSLELGRRAAELDPVNGEIRYWLGRTYICADLLSEGEAELRRAAELSPSLLSVHRQLSTVLVLQGRAAEAVAEARLEKDEWSRQAALAVAYWAAKDVPAADAALARLIAVASESAAYQVAEGYAFRGESDKAFEWLDRAYRNRDSGFGQLRADPLLKSLRGDPRWALLLKQAGLADEQLK